MDITPGLKQVEEAGVGFKKDIYRNSSNISVTKLLYTYANKNELSTPYGNLFRSFNFPITLDEQTEFSSQHDGTALEWLNVDEIIVVEIPKGEYGELIDGKTFKLTFPVTLNSIATSTTVYGTYFGFLNGQYIGGKNLNNQYSERNQNYFGFEPTESNNYNTNVTFLYSNDIQIPIDKGDEVTVLTSSTYSITGNASSKFDITDVTFNTGDIIKVTYSTSPSSSINKMVIEVGNTKLINNNFVTIEEPGILNVSPKAYLDQPSPASTPIVLTIQIKKQQSTNVLSWNVWSATNKFPTVATDESQKMYATYESDLQNKLGYDKPVGILYQDKGFVVITDPTLVQAFRYSAGTSTGYNGIPSGNSYNGDKNFAKIYFPTFNDSNSQFDSITTEFVQNIICIANAGEFVTTTNKTYEDAYDEDATEKPVFITSIGLYNANKELIGIGKLSEPIKKLPTTIVPFNIRLVV